MRNFSGITLQWRGTQLSAIRRLNSGTQLGSSVTCFDDVSWSPASRVRSLVLRNTSQEKAV
jgi:hypothetical protein